MKFLGHIGLYAFRMNALKRFVELPPGRLEGIEKLEQLRLLENGIPIHVVITELQSFGVDRPEDIKRVSRLIDPSSMSKTG
jgi:3-deoxy-manno-octulosonate cytidylyltransferase (CMP-KDO synthetase)